MHARCANVDVVYINKVPRDLFIRSSAIACSEKGLHILLNSLTDQKPMSAFFLQRKKKEKETAERKQPAPLRKT